jgi:hypothetical protein
MQLRWINADSAYLSVTFVLGDQSGLKVGFVYSDSVLLYWENRGQADSFEILRLDDKHFGVCALLLIRFIPSFEWKGYRFAVAPLYSGHNGPEVMV